MCCNDESPGAGALLGGRSVVALLPTQAEMLGTDYWPRRVSAVQPRLEEQEDKGEKRGLIQGEYE